MLTDSQLRKVALITEEIRPSLADLPAEVQGAILADLLAIWLAGHHVEGDASATREWRIGLLALHTRAVLDLVPINAKNIGTTP